MNDLVTEALPLGHPFHHIPIVPYGPSKGITVLGVPCDSKNSTTHADTHWELTVQKTTETLRKLRELPDGQLRHCLLRHCLDACKVNHLMRSTLLSTGPDAMNKLTAALQTAVSDIIGSGVTVGAWEQATLPIRHGGLGIKDPTHLRPLARTAALANFHSRGHLVGAPDDVVAFLSNDVQDTLVLTSERVGPNHDIVTSGWGMLPRCG